MRRLLMVMLLILIGCACGWACRPEATVKEPALIDFPELFKEQTIIVIGENASKSEFELAEGIEAYLDGTDRDEISVKYDTQVSDKDKSSYNLILIGIIGSNNLLNRVYDLTDVARATQDYPGGNKSLLEILSNPWNAGKAILIIAGSDERGIKAGSDVLQDIGELTEEETNDWILPPTGSVAYYLGLNLSDFRILEQEVREYFLEHYPHLADWADFPITYAWIETTTEYRVIKAYGIFEIPYPFLTVGINDSEFHVISEEFEAQMVVAGGQNDSEGTIIQSETFSLGSGQSKVVYAKGNEEYIFKLSTSGGLTCLADISVKQQDISTGIESELYQKTLQCGESVDIIETKVVLGSTGDFIPSALFIIHY